MDDRSPALEVLDATYRCPGHHHDIDRSVHLARLAAFYPACRDCEHRSDIRSLSSLQQRQWAEVERRQRPAATFGGEGLAADHAGAIDAAVVRRIAAALARLLWQASEASRRPTVLVGSDGHWSSADLLSAACEVLQWAGCRTFELGACTSASLAVAMRRIQADAALAIGNATGQQHAMSVRLWGAEACPWSSPGRLDPLQRAWEAPGDRPQRHGGTLERCCVDELYLAPLRQLLHALRPLRFAVDTASEPFLTCLCHLTDYSACRVLLPQPPSETPATKPSGAFLDRRHEQLSRRVRSHDAHFGLWTSGDGECLRLIDERGALVDDERLCLTLASFVCRQKPGASLVVHEGASAALQHGLAQLGAQVIVAKPTRQSMFEITESSGAVLGAGPGGQFWFEGQPTAPDALLALCLFLTIFSESDRPVSEVILPLGH